MTLNETFLVKILDIYSALSMKDCIIGPTLLLVYLAQSQNINKWFISNLACIYRLLKAKKAVWGLFNIKKIYL